MNICIPKPAKDAFRQAVKEGKINPDDLSIMTSAERNLMFEHLLGKENASTVNALIESKLLLKDQQRGFIDAIQQVLGTKSPAAKDLLSRINKMDSLLNPAEKEAFMQDLASQKIGTKVNYEEAQQISQLANDTQTALDNATGEIGSPSRLDYGAKLVKMQDYIKELKLPNETTAENAKRTLGEFKANPLKATGKTVNEVAGLAKGVKASLDNSAIFRQGWKTLFTNPDLWAKNALDSFSNIKNQLGKDAFDNTVIDGVKADVYSRPNAINGNYKRMGIDIGNMEEAFPTTLPEKIPLFGRLYKASEVAYTGFLYRMRADIADKMIQIATDGGVDLADKTEMKQIGQLVNSLTGRGSLGEFEKVGKSINTVFFSPKMLMSNIDFLTGHNLHADVTPFVRKQAAINLVKVTAGIATILGIAHAIAPKSVDFDPRSADFGKIRIGDTRFDATAGMGSLVTLAAREITQSSKSSTTHKVTKLNSGKFGSQTGMDVLTNFGENKLSPVASVIKDVLNKKDFNGNPVTVSGETSNLLTPLPIQNAMELWQNPKSANFVAATLADSLGIATNTYSLQKKHK